MHKPPMSLRRRLPRPPPPPRQRHRHHNRHTYNRHNGSRRHNMHRGKRCRRNTYRRREGGRRCRHRGREPPRHHRGREPPSYPSDRDRQRRHRGRAPPSRPSDRDRQRHHRRRGNSPTRRRWALSTPLTAHQERRSSAVSSLACFLIGWSWRGGWLQRHLFRPSRWLKDELGVGGMNVEVPIGELGDEVGLAGQRSVGDDQPPRERLLAFREPQLELDAGRLRKEQVIIGRAVDRHGVDDAARGYPCQKRLGRGLAQQIGEREIDAEATDRLLHHGFDRALRHRYARVFVVRGRIDDRGLAVEGELARAVVSAYLGQHSVWPVHGDLHRVEDVKRLAVRVGVDADRLGLKRELVRTQALPHAQKGCTSVIADRRLCLFGGLRRGRDERQNPDGTAGKQSAKNYEVSQLHEFPSFAQVYRATSLDAGATPYVVVKELARLTWINHSPRRRDVAICDTTGAEIKPPGPL